MEYKLITERVCTRCKQLKLINDFPRKGVGTTGRIKYRYVCKVCDYKRTREALFKRRDVIDWVRKARPNKQKELSVWFLEYKQSLVCTDCLLPFRDHPYLCDFHHIDAANKNGNIARIVADSGNRVKLEEELSKCIPLCANCHRTRTWGRKRYL